MKILATLALLVALAGCTEKTEYGHCIGAFSDRDPKLKYEVSGFNVFLAIFFFELIAPPAIVIFNETLCPVGVK